MPLEVPWTLNRELLTPANDRIQFLVEHRAGAHPQVEALDGLVELASRYGGRPARWRKRLRDEPLVLEPDVTYVIVKYVGDQLPGFGLAYGRRVEGRSVYVLVVNQEAHHRWSAIMPVRWLEQQTLVHEYGHLLGLPTPDHGYYPRWPARTDGLHCVRPDCPLSKPRPRAVLYNAFHTAFGRHYLVDYCEECRRAIAAVQAYWAGGTPREMSGAGGVAAPTRGPGRSRRSGRAGAPPPW